MLTKDLHNLFGEIVTIYYDDNFRRREEYTTTVQPMIWLKEDAEKDLFSGQWMHSSKVRYCDKCWLGYESINCVCGGWLKNTESIRYI